MSRKAYRNKENRDEHSSDAPGLLCGACVCPQEVVLGAQSVECTLWLEGNGHKAVHGGIGERSHDILLFRQSLF
jgi:hypothetical protein